MRFRLSVEVDIFFSYGRFGVVSFLKLGNKGGSKMLKIALYVMYGILVLAISAFCFLEISKAVALFVVMFSIVAFIYAGIEIEKLKKDKPNCEPVMFEDLDSATYVVNKNPYVFVYGQAENIFRYFMLVECITKPNRNGWPIIVEIPEDKNNRYKLQLAMGKYIEEIETGEVFKVNKDHSITT